MRLFNFENKKVEHFDDEMEANGLIEDGKAVKLDVPQLEEAERKAEEVYNTYRSRVDSIKNSDNPLLQDEKVQEYELDRIRKEYEQQSQQVQEEYAQWRAKAIEDARKRSVQAAINVCKSDKRVGDQFANRASLQLAGAIGDEKGVAVNKVIEQIGLLTDEQRTALQDNAGQILANIDDDVSKRKVARAIQEVRNPDLLAETMTQQLPIDVLHKQRIEKMAKKVVKGEIAGVYKR